MNSSITGTATVSASGSTPATATFLKQDSKTQGTWMGTYGAQGYDVIDGSSSLPSEATITPSGQSNYVWASFTTDTRALQTSGGSSRIAATWFSLTSFSVDVNLTDRQAHDLELYFLDWDLLGRTEQVQISNASTGPVLSTQSISSFQSGVYLRLCGEREYRDHDHQPGRQERGAQRPVPRSPRSRRRSPGPARRALCTGRR